MVALDEPPFVFDNTGVDGPVWIIELLRLQNEFEVSMRIQNAKTFLHVTLTTLQTQSNPTPAVIAQSLTKINGSQAIRGIY
jgi:hypothetical protein